MRLERLSSITNVARFLDAPEETVMQLLEEGRLGGALVAALSSRGVAVTPNLKNSVATVVRTVSPESRPGSAWQGQFLSTCLRHHRDHNVHGYRRFQRHHRATGRPNGQRSSRGAKRDHPSADKDSRRRGGQVHGRRIHADLPKRPPVPGWPERWPSRGNWPTTTGSTPSANWRYAWDYRWESRYERKRTCLGTR